MSGDVFLGVMTAQGVISPGVWRVQARDADKTPVVQRRPHNKELSGQIIDSAMTEKPCFKDFKFLC